MACPPPPPPLGGPADDIRKMGQLVKIKTNKKKYFVLRDETQSSSARLEYYDSEKKWRSSGSMPKRTIVLKNCFNINSKPDAKHRFAIALYTKDDCFAVACQTEEDQRDWLASMIELRNRNLDDCTATTRPLFEHIWPVTVKSKGLGGNEKKVIPGGYRLCLTNKDLSLIRMNNYQSDIVLPLDCIRRCGHTHQFFFLELGRSAMTGSGHLWLQVEDMVIAQNIHEALLSSMKNNEVPAPGSIRLRSGSSATEHGRKRSSVTSTNLLPKRHESIYTSNPSSMASSQGDTSSSSSSLVRLEKRPTFSGGKRPSSELSLPTPVGMTSGCRSDGIIEEELARTTPHYIPINPLAENQSVNHFDASLKRRSEAGIGVGTGAGADGGLKLSGAPYGDDNIPMFQTNKLPVVAVAPSLAWPEGARDYVPMVTPADDSYMMMSAGGRADEAHGTGLEAAHGSNSSVSSVMSSVGSMSIVESSERSCVSLSHLQEVSAADGGYIEMASPQNLLAEHSLGAILRPDVVPCYVRDESAGAEDFPKRAYSVGSKPVPVPNKPLNSSYIDMSGKSSSAKTKTKKEAASEKSSSAPHLNDDDEKKRELSDLFMELDFNRTKRDVGATAAAAAAKGAKDLFRERASSGGSRELRLKAMSVNTKEAIQRLSIFSARNRSTAAADGRRARTSTICQESLRPRTSSFGPSDQRPRSSSGGNACFADVLSRQTAAGSGGHGGKRSSQESVEPGRSGGAADAYMNMSLGKRGTAGGEQRLLGKVVGADAGYMDMKPGEERGGEESDYMRMTAGGGAPGIVATTATTATPSLGVVMRQKLETVKAGTGEDYLEMTLDGAARDGASKAASLQAKSKVSADYMEMAPRGPSNERSAAAPKAARRDVSSSQPRNDDYMMMSAGSGRPGSSSAASENDCAAVNPLALPPPAQTTTRSSVALVSPPDARESARSGSTEDVPPPFDLSIPFQSFLLHTNHATERNPTTTIPVQSPASRSSPTPATTTTTVTTTTTGGSTDSLELPGPVQISYATLDLGSSVDGRPVEGRGSGVAGRGRGGFGAASHRHVYAQIDFGKSDDRHK